MRSSFFAAALAAVALSACNSSTTSAPTIATATATAAPSPASTLTPLAGLKSKINHIVVIVQENWSFDGLYGHFPGANGVGSVLAAGQVDMNGAPIATLPQPLNGGKPDNRFPPSGTLPAAPFDLSAYVAADSLVYTGDPNHNFFVQQYQIDGAPVTASIPGAGGKMDRYLALAGIPGDGTQGGLPMGEYDVTNLPEGKIAQQFVLADNFHQSAYGGSYINNMWLFCACTNTYPNAPASIVEQYDASGNPVQLGSPEGRVTSDGYAVNTIFPANYPQTAGYSPGDAIHLVPPQTATTIGDELSAANVSWKWYAGGLNAALAGNPPVTYQPHHQSPLYFANQAPGTPGAAHVVDESAFFSDLAGGTLPAVSFVKNLGEYNEHPFYTNLLSGQLYTAYLINQIMMSSAWKDVLVVIYYDEAGGHYDHVAPVPVDRFGPSTRVPALIVSPWAKRGFVDHSNYEVTSILNTIETRFGLAPLGSRDAAAAPLLGALDFTQSTTSALARRPFGITQAPPAPPPPHSRTGHTPVTEVDD